MTRNCLLFHKDSCSRRGGDLLTRFPSNDDMRYVTFLTVYWSIGLKSKLLLA